MIDIFEVQRLIDSNPEHSNLDTIVMSIDNHISLNEYFKDTKYKGYYMLALAILDNETMYLGKKPKRIE